MAIGGVGLGLVTAALWGVADTIAGLAARRWPLVKVTLVSQAAGLLALLTWGGITASFSFHKLSSDTIVASVGIGLLTGVCAAVGYLSFYRALAIGPMALVSPLTSTSSLCTLFLSLTLLRQRLLPLQLGAIGLIIAGVLLAVTDWQDLRSSLSLKGFGASGIRYALVASLAFGCMDFGIGASAQFSGWYLPVFWTRVFCVSGLLLAAGWQHQRQSSCNRGIRLRPTATATELRPIVTTQGALSHLRPTTVFAFALCLLGVSVSRALSWMLARLRGLHGLWLGCRFQYTRTAALLIGPNKLVRVRGIPLAVTDQHAPSFTPSNLPHPTRMAIRPLRCTSTLSHYREESSIRQRITVFVRTGVALAIIAGLAENVGALCFSLDTLVATTGVAGVIASGYSLFVMAMGLGICRERLQRNQVGGISLFLSGILLLGLVG